MLRAARAQVIGSVALVMAGSGVLAPADDAVDAAEPAAARGPVVRVTSKRLPGAPAVSGGLVGANQRWLGNADGALNRDGTLNRSVGHRAREMGLRAVRYPGGTVANLFDWRHATKGGRGCQTSGGFADGWFATVPRSDNKYTIGRDATFLRRIHGRVNLMVPMINSTPRAARRFVRRVAAATNARHLTVEIGNEPTHDKQHYWRSLHDQRRRLHQYINGGHQVQGPASHGKADDGHRGLFHVSGCNLRHPVRRAHGAADQVYRTRYLPISTKRPPVINVNGHPWHYVPNLHRRSGRAHVFTINGHGTRIRFGDGRHGAKPRGRIRISRNHPYVAVRQPGFRDFYRALKHLARTSHHIRRIRVCSSWATRSFVEAMDRGHGGRYDCLAVHSYAHVRRAGTALADHRALQRWARRLNGELRHLRHAARHSPVAGARRRSLIVTEYGSLNSPYKHESRKFLYTLYIDRLLMGQVRAGVRIGNISNFAALFPKTGPRRYGLSSRARLLSLWHRLAGERPVRVRCPGCTVPDSVRILATRKHKTVHLMLLNTGARRRATWSPRFAVAHRGGGSCVTIRRMRAGLNANDMPARAKGPVPSMRPVRARKWRAGTPFPRDGGVRTVYAHSLELMTISPVPAGGRCRTHRF